MPEYLLHARRFLAAAWPCAVWLVWAVGELAVPLYALDPGRQVSQYGHTAWRLQDGVFESAPNAITQTSDGYLWLGTETGLVRFDGVSFTRWSAPGGESLPGTSVISLLGARDGSLWIGTSGGLARWKGGHLVNYPETGGRINAILEDFQGNVWAVRSRVRDPKGPLCQAMEGRARCFGPADGIPFQWAETVADDRAGGLWIGTTIGLSHWKPGAVTNYFPAGLKHMQGASGVEAVTVAPDGSPLIGVGQAGAGLGLQTVTDGAWKEYPLPQGRGSALAVEALLIDRDRGLWISTVDAGIYHVHLGHVHGGQVDRFRQADGLSSDTVLAFYQDREGNVWTVSPRGIDRFRDLPVATLSKREGLTTDSVGSVLASRSGVVWVGNGRSLISIQEGKFAATRAEEGLPGTRVSALLEDHAGKLWVGVDTGLSVRDGNRFRAIRRGGGVPVGMVIGMAEDKDGNVWAMTTGRPQKLLRIRDFQIVEEIVQSGPISGAGLAADPAGGIWLGRQNGELAHYPAGRTEARVPANASASIRSVIASPDGSAWAATAKGLLRWQEGKWRRLDEGSGLPCQNLFSALQDEQGGLWLYATCGLLKIDAAEWARWWRQPGGKVAVTVFDGFDGAQPGSTPFAPAASRAPDGRLWFTNDSVLQFIDPARVRRNPLPPPVVIERIVADRLDYAPRENVRLPAHTRNVQIDYTALSLAVPQKVRFRYKLEGRDESWQEPGGRRQAFYSDLAPGSYRFQVVACNNDGVWNVEGATWTFRVAPAYYETAWFRLLAAALCLLALWGFYQLRVWQLARAWNARFDERMAERDRLAGELHDTFLQSVQASKMVADQALEQAWGDDAPDSLRLRKAMETLSKWLQQASVDGRAALKSLRTSTGLQNDLAEGLQRAAEVSRQGAEMELVVSVEGTAREVHPIVRDEVYRIGSEAIRNAFLHSRGDKLAVKITYARDLTVRVRDNGKGIDRDIAARRESGHFGMAGMKERAIRIGGQFRVSSRSKLGTEIELKVPGRIAFLNSRRAGFSARLRNFWGTEGSNGK